MFTSPKEFGLEGETDTEISNSARPGDVTGLMGKVRTKQPIHVCVHLFWVTGGSQNSVRIWGKM